MAGTWLLDMRELVLESLVLVGQAVQELQEQPSASASQEQVVQEESMEVVSVVAARVVLVVAPVEIHMELDEERKRAGSQETVPCLQQRLILGLLFWVTFSAGSGVCHVATGSSSESGCPENSGVLHSSLPAWGTEWVDKAAVVVPAGNSA